ncbi:hypothetical protein Hanom_Chr17g01544641 [Helianthus anomalus]
MILLESSLMLVQLEQRLHFQLQHSPMVFLKVNIPSPHQGPIQHDCHHEPEHLSDP